MSWISISRRIMPHTRLVGDRELVEEGVPSGDGALVDESRSVHLGGTSLEESVPVLHNNQSVKFDRHGPFCLENDTCDGCSPTHVSIGELINHINLKPVVDVPGDERGNRSTLSSNSAEEREISVT